jgi:ABC-2 type transport system permease protein
MRRTRAQTRVRYELLRNLVRKDLKVKYKGSTLGFAWSLANPLLLLAVYYVVFQVILPGRIPSFAIYLMSGLLVWNAFSSAVTGAATSVVGNANLVKKVRFPLPVLPLSAVGFAAVHFVLQMLSSSWRSATRSGGCSCCSSSRHCSPRSSSPSG